MEKPHELIPKPWSTISVVITSLLLMAFIVTNSWISDDAYISFRFVDNLIEGHGLRWNIYERVQAYTHPLWMFLHIPFYALSGNIFLTSMFLSIACSIAAVVIAFKTFERPAHIVILCLLMPLMLSKTFVEYSTSGLENPLSHLLFACFGYILIKKQHTPRFWLYLSLVVALSLINRLDTVIIYAPVLTWLTLVHLRTIRWSHIGIGALPLIMWLTFTLFYYGFVFPNTKYAKLNTGIESLALTQQGVLYLLELFSSDVFTFMMLCVILAHVFDLIKDLTKLHILRRPLNKDAPSTTMTMIGIGIFTYIAYIISVGGDFMSGRFFSLPYFITVWLIFYYVTELGTKRAFVCFAFLLALKYQAISMSDDFKTRCVAQLEISTDNPSSAHCVKSGIADERAFYSPTRVWYYNGRFSTDRIKEDFHYQSGLEALADPDTIHIYSAVGLRAYTAGPTVHIVDYLALTDPLLSRLPTIDPNSWRIGHFRRHIPDGYLFSIRHHRFDQMHPALAAYYKPLRLIVSGDLFDPKRIQAIIDFNLGRYDHFLEEYLHHEDAITD